MRIRTWSALTTVMALLAVAACERSRQQPPADTSAPPPPAIDTMVALSSQSAWDAAAGPVLLVRGATTTEALVVLPEYADSTLPDTLHLDAPSVRGAIVDIFGRGGRLGQAQVADVLGTTWTGDDCIEWPKATVRRTTTPAAAQPGATAPPASRGSLPEWAVSFLGGHVEPVPLDSIEALTPPDSARLAVEAARLASTLPNDTALAFRGIPFSVRTAYRFTAPDGAHVLVADVLRKVNQEANPLEEHILLVAERDTTAQQSERYRSVYSERTSGTEEGIETSEVLAAVRLGGDRVLLVLGRQGLETAAYALLERFAPARWRVKWTSVHTGC